jgi:hypothetical protein
MDLENGIQMGKIPLTDGVSSLPSPKSHKVMIGHPDFDPKDDDEYLKKLPEWTIREMAIAGVAGASGEFVVWQSFCSSGIFSYF